MQPSYHIYPLGETAVTIAFDAVIDEAVNHYVTALQHHLNSLELKWVKDIIPAYHTLGVVYDQYAFKHRQSSVFNLVNALLEEAIETCNWQLHTTNKIIEIPVCYHPSLGIDIEELAVTKNLSIDEVIAIHASKTYHVFAIGFLPGFAYMGSVDERIAMPRKAQPRTNINKGAVGIAGEQTGIYPLNSPGGWNIIGQTPLAMFDAFNETPSLLKQGDSVRFKQVSLHEFYVLASLIKKTSKQKQTTATGLEIIKHGIADSIQDLGRVGYQHLGINPNGVMDMVAAKTANFLAGNKADEAVIELHFPASSFRFNCSALIALSGADFDAAVDGKPVTINKPVLVAKDAVLQFRKNKNGARCYLAVHGGFAIKQWLNSYSTNVKANVGGHCGRLLKKGDSIGFKQQPGLFNLPANKSLVRLPWSAAVDYFYTASNVIRCVTANEYVFLNDVSKDCFPVSQYKITLQSDRMGYRLQGTPLLMQTPVSLLSTAVTKGTIQLLPNGQLIVLMSDHQTMGGYPRVAHVVQADIAKLAQMQPHQHIQFQFISHAEAEILSFKQQQYLLSIQNACIFKLQDFL